MRVNYRVWDKENNKWFKPTYEAYKGNLEELLSLPDGSLVLRTIDSISHESTFPNRFEKVLYTGLLIVKSGIEVAEKDIVRIRGVIPGVEMNDIGIVEFIEGSWMVEKIDRSDGWYLFQEGAEIEVLGNVFENPELLDWRG
ncbi:TPA: hypothetical protein ROY11_004489 [Bacillus cereus]|nr:hypothetical protein [Bacillus cereus]